mmetsp:Transcript_22953/g.79715  ORF Transcript_22953/g.79715 Transcript_22953/m.79715 type:complete len:91 (-) Transcript_22953:53-325(-)
MRATFQVDFSPPEARALRLCYATTRAADVFDAAAFDRLCADGRSTLKKTVGEKKALGDEAPKTSSKTARKKDAGHDRHGATSLADAPALR